MSLEAARRWPEVEGGHDAGRIAGVVGLASLEDCVETITFSLEPEGERVPFETLEAAVRGMRRLISDVDEAVAHQTGAAPRRWFVERLSSSYPTSPTVCLIPSEGEGGGELSTGRALVLGVGSISTGVAVGPPAYFSEREMEDLVRLKRSVISRGVKRIEIGSGEYPKAAVTASIESKIKAILRDEVSAQGSLEGELDAISVRRAPTFTIWERTTGRAVRCFFGEEQLETVRSLLHSRVHVAGRVNYFRDGKPRSVSGITELVAVPAFSRIPARDFWNSVPNLTGGIESVEYLRAAGFD